MAKFKTILKYIATFLVGATIAIYFEDSFHHIVRQLYSSLTYNKISFRMPKLDLYFTFLEFAYSFGLFLTLLLFLFVGQTKRQKLLNSILTLIFMTITLLLFCYFDANIKLIECTACDDGTRIMEYSDLNYTKILIITLLISLIPCIWTKISNNRKAKRLDILKAST